jgi:hypothetical protein
MVEPARWSLAAERPAAPLNNSVSSGAVFVSPHAAIRTMVQAARANGVMRYLMIPPGNER